MRQKAAYLLMSQPSLVQRDCFSKRLQRLYTRDQPCKLLFHLKSFDIELQSILSAFNLLETGYMM